MDGVLGVLAIFLTIVVGVLFAAIQNERFRRQKVEDLEQMPAAVQDAVAKLQAATTKDHCQDTPSKPYDDINKDQDHAT
jgi:type II secretory pathway pseudopilin PulG